MIHIRLLIRGLVIPWPLAMLGCCFGDAQDIRKTYWHDAINVLYKWGNGLTQDHTSQPKTTEANRSILGIYLVRLLVVAAMDILGHLSALLPGQHKLLISKPLANVKH